MMQSILPFLRVLRPWQWIKNLFVLAPLLFALKFTESASWSLSLIALTVFIFFSSAVYVFNDIFDRDSDRKHPNKKLRPIASGSISITSSYVLFAILTLLGGLLLKFLPESCAYIAMGYLLLNIIYSLWAKHVAVLDVICIASGFVLRVLMGAEAINAPASPWIVVSTFALTLFIGFGKRRYELSQHITHSSKSVRKSLHEYNPEFIDKLVNVSCATSLVTYIIYVVEMSGMLGRIGLTYTIVFVVFGLFRYMQFIYVENKGGDPESILMRDTLFLLNGILWLATTLWMLS